MHEQSVHEQPIAPEQVADGRVDDEQGRASAPKREGWGRRAVAAGVALSLLGGGGAVWWRWDSAQAARLGAAQDLAREAKSGLADSLSRGESALQDELLDIWGARLPEREDLSDAVSAARELAAAEPPAGSRAEQADLLAARAEQMGENAARVTEAVQSLEDAAALVELGSSRRSWDRAVTKIAERIVLVEALCVSLLDQDPLLVPAGVVLLASAAIYDRETASATKPDYDDVDALYTSSDVLWDAIYSLEDVLDAAGVNYRVL